MLTRTPEMFRDVCRIPIPLFEKLVRDLAPHLAPDPACPRADVVCVKERVFLGLVMFAQPGGYVTTYTTELVGRGKETIRASAVMLAKAVVLQYYHDLVSLPDAEEMLLQMRWFTEHRGFPGCIGGMDGKHFVVEAGANDKANATNFHGSRSLSILALADNAYMFRWMSDARDGVTTDGRIWATTSFKRRQMDPSAWPPRFADGRAPCVKLPGDGGLVFPHIAVDAAFGGTRNTTRPFPRKNMTQRQAVYNKIQSSARMVIEQAWGMLVCHRTTHMHTQTTQTHPHTQVNKFQIWRGPLRVKGHKWRETANLFIVCTMVLHNMCREYVVSTKIPDTYGGGHGGLANYERESEAELLARIEREQEEREAAARDVYISAAYDDTISHKQLQGALATHLDNTYFLDEDGKQRARFKEKFSFGGAQPARRRMTGAISLSASRDSHART
jgi:hypothetical protein